MNNNPNPNFQELQKIQSNKIHYFCHQIRDNDISRAERYLNQTNWDEYAAVQLFFRNHPNHAPHNHQNYFPQNQPQFQPQLPPPSQINDRSRPQLSNVAKKENYMEFLIGQVLINNRNIIQPRSKCLDYIYNNLKNVEKNFGAFLSQLRNKPGIIIVINEASFNSIQDQIKQFSGKSDVLKNCVIYPVLKNFPIGNELVQQLSIFSYPCYIFCKYKDDKNFYLTDRMEGAFDINFFLNSIRKNQPEQKERNKNLDLNPKTDIKINNNKDLNKNLNNNNLNRNNNNIKKENKDVKKDNLINNLKKNNYFDVRQKSNINPRYNQHQVNPNSKINQNINKNNNFNPNLGPQEKNIINQQNNNNKIEENIGDYFLGDSQEMLSLFNQNNNNNYRNNNNNNFQNPNLNFENPSNKNEKLNPNNNQNNENNILADSIYQLSDGQVLQKRENEMKALEREHEEKQRKEEEEKRKQLEEENRIEQIKKNYEDEAEIAKQFLSEEPEEGNPDACKIAFRVPDGEKTIERRFLKTDKISVLYNYVKSIGRDIFTEPDSNDFDLCIPFPPKNLRDKMNNTLEEEGLFPNSLLQIREK